MLTSFLLFFLLFTGTGMAAWFWHKNTVDDYFLASREMPAWLVALSFGATISSGATFVGFAGLAYKTGMLAVFSVVGLMLGDYTAWRIAGTKIRNETEEKDIKTYPALVGSIGKNNLPVATLVTALLSVVFLGTYCAAQLVAGAKIGAALFHWDYATFVFLGAGVLLSYCWAGGIRASIWTDAVQAVIIILSLVVLIISGLQQIGGFGPMWEKLTAIDPKLTSFTEPGLLAAFAGWFAFGVGVLGQPQLMVRHMVAKSNNCIKTACRVYMTWRWTVLALSLCSGMIARVLIPSTEGFDPELSVPLLWQDLLPPVLVGLLIAGLFSATMSTADSLLLSASSALTQHILPKWSNSYTLARVGTLIVLGLVVLIALFANKGVLALVILAWGGMASAIGPLIVVMLMGATVTRRTAIAMMTGGFATMLVWRYVLELNGVLMDLFPGMVTGFGVFLISKIMEKKPAKSIA